MTTLAIESSTARAGMAMCDGRKLLAEIQFPTGRGENPETLYEGLQALLHKGPRPQRLVVGIGPGSYSGTRIGIAVAIGVATALNIPLHGLTSYLGFDAGLHYHVLGDARRGSFYHAEIRNGTCVTAPRLLERKAVDVLMRGRGDAPVVSPDPLPDFPGVRQMQPMAAVLARAALATDSPLVDGSSGLEPLYLRPPCITAPKPIPSCRAFPPTHSGWRRGGFPR